MALTDLRVDGIGVVRRNVSAMTMDHLKMLRTETRRSALEASRAIKRRYSGMPIRSRSGLLRRSVKFKRVGGSDAWEVFTDVKYAETHEEGKTIKPRFKGGRFIVTGRRFDGKLKGRMSRGTKLAIPIGIAKTRAGVAKSDKIDRTAMDLARRYSFGLPFRTFTGAINPKLNPDVLYLSTPTSRFTRNASGKRVRVWKTRAIAVLKDRVKVKKRPIWRPVATLSQKLLSKRVERGVRDLIRKHGGA